MNFLRRHKWTRITLRVLAISVVLYLALVSLGIYLVMELPRVPVKATPSAVGLSYEEISFSSRDPEITLQGWFMPGAGNKVIVFVHGGYQPRVDENVNTLAIVRDLVPRGYSVLLFDMRGRGESDGKARSLMYGERDIAGAVDYLKSRGYAPGSIGIIGYCSGAASTVKFASGEEIGGLVLDGCFPRTHGMIEQLALGKRIPHWVVNIFYGGLTTAAHVYYGFSVWDPIDYMPRVDAPAIFFHEENDILVNSLETRTLLQASVHPDNEIWEIPGVAHSRAYNTYPVEYVDRVDAFFRVVLK